MVDVRETPIDAKCSINGHLYRLTD